ncbi:glutamic-type intramembrane protease PrsW [Paenibacillus chitinolyticus]|uniref:Protease PrsW n=1 Tax=Paenibacillus chitinolyticus TaxID=79263 RepID=A0A410WV92_9BACL|nr:MULTISPECIES: glutamic-type intramembrane protease PrsW [Paenibacillus]MCY9589398.1 glutamic-type intramembrane protease PrsW [Paenibacillus chitinolyticus]MCY9594471.1 glutamic-type intramembrane protease PrsW [Paenibacillus chitinolyticus]QAV18282.1 PrsW family intramembrane metalloprotease [Paenibacillus chitinolyticus]
MNVFSVLMAAVAPGISLLAYFYLKDRYETEPIHLVGKLFLCGVLLVIPAMVLQNSFMQEIGGDNHFTFAFFISGGLEEFLKWFVVYHLIYRHDSFDEPYDGIVYAVAVSLGFATLENILYAFANGISMSSLLMRALLPVSGHALFGVMMGYYLGKAKFMRSQERKYLLASLFLPILWHGAFDYILLVAANNWIWFMLPFMTLLWIRTLWKVDRANDRSPLRVVRGEEEFKIG